MQIGERIRQRRLFLHITQKELAEYLHVTSAQVSAIESGKSNLTVDKLLCIAKVLQCSPSSLIDNIELGYPRDKETALHIQTLETMFYEGSFNQMIELVDKTLQCESAEPRMCSVEINMWKCKALFELRRRNEAIQLCNELLSYGINRQFILCNVELTLGASLALSEQCEEGLSHLLIAKGIAYKSDRVVFKPVKKEILYHLGSVYSQLGQYKLSNEHLEMFRDEVRGQMYYDLKLAARARFVSSSNYYKMDNLRRAYTYAVKSIELYKFCDDIRNLSQILVNCAQICRKLGMYDRAERYFRDCINLIRQNPKEVPDRVRIELVKCGYEWFD